MCYAEAMNQGDVSIEISVVAAAHNEQDNLPTLVDEIVAALDPLDMEYEIVVVDDGSTDDTPNVLDTLLKAQPRLRAIRMLDTPPNSGHGQSAAFYAGFRAAHGNLIVPIDGDLQNDPADIPAMIVLLKEKNADLVQGDRSAARKDNLVRRVTSFVGRLFRRWLLGDTIRDTGCSLRVMKREIALALPLEFRGIHRFIPVTARQLGYNVIETPVRHRPRTAGRTNYGIWNRAIPGLIDCFAVRWMRKRRRPTEFRELERPDMDRISAFQPSESAVRNDRPQETRQ